jgi:hypothetical protein
MKSQSKIVVRMINKCKDDTHKHLNEFRKFKQLNYIRKVMQYMEEAFNKDIEILKIIKLKHWK